MGSNYTKGNQGKIKYNVDIAMVIDATGSMGGLIDIVKKNALNIYSDIINRMEAKAKNIDELRVRVIAFRDYIADGDNAMLATDFFPLPEASADFESLVNSINADGGGDEPEDGLEALAYAINSKWTTGGNKRRHIIVLWSDAETHKLGYAISAPNYPKKMAKDFDELTERWDNMDFNAKRLLIFAPEKKYWTNIADNWENVIHFPSEAGKGLQGLDYEEILDAISNSI